MLTGSTDSSEAAREFLQDRMARFSRLVAVMVGLSVVGRLIRIISEERWEYFARPAFPALVIIALMFGGLWLLCRKGHPPLHKIRVLELIALVVSAALAVWATRIMPLESHPELHTLIALAFLIVGRTIYVPSTARHTLVIGVAMGIPLVGSTFALFAAVDPAALEATYGAYLGLEGLRIAGVIAGWTGMYWAVFVVICILGSRVIYGLREEVKDARSLGQYRLIKKLGSGGMGEVWLAQHAMLRRPTAVKLLRHDKVGEAAMARFEREVQLTADLSHPNTVTIYDFGRAPDGTFYYVMELLEGGTLEEVVAVDGPQPPERVVHILQQMAGALAEAHDVGLIHRDIKPANVMLCKRGGRDDVAKVFDFGLVKELDRDVSLSLSAHETTVSGTPLYMSPESILAPGDLDSRSDLYAVGAVGYFLLTGHHVFEGNTVMEICARHLRDTPVPPSERLGSALPADLEALILECLAKEPDARPKDAATLQARLNACLVDPWDGTWWWSEYGHLVHKDGAAGLESSEVGMSLEVDLAQR